jgi:hypothetical protein
MRMEMADVKEQNIAKIKPQFTKREKDEILNSYFRAKKELGGNL